MSNDYNDLSYYELKPVCRNKGLSDKGKKVVLLARLEAYDAGITGLSDKEPEAVEAPPEPEKQPIAKTNLLSAQKPSVEPPQEPTPAEERKQRLNFDPSSGGNIRQRIGNLDLPEYQPYITNERLQRLEYQLNPICAQKGTCKFHIDRQRGEYQVRFTGGASGAASTTLICHDSVIINAATHHFTARLAQGRNGQKTIIT